MSRERVSGVKMSDITVSCVSISGVSMRGVRVSESERCVNWKCCGRFSEHDTTRHCEVTLIANNDSSAISNTRELHAMAANPNSNAVLNARHLHNMTTLRLQIPIGALSSMGANCAPLLEFAIAAPSLTRTRCAP